MKQPILTASIVTYKNDFEKLSHAISSFLNTKLKVRLYIFDNSPTNKIKNLCYDRRITYFHSSQNIGFGRGHNFLMKKIIDQSPLHLVMNPDVYFREGVLETLVQYLNDHPEVGLAMPKILNPDGTLQHNCKLLPTPYNLIVRRFFYPFKGALQKSNYKYEMRFSGYDKEMEVPYLSGCFMFLRMEAIQKIGLFDDKFFLYGEDIDLSRRMHRHYKTMYLPKVSVYHYHEKGSYKSLRLLWHNIRSAVLYFNKWGWWKDEERVVVNERIIKKTKADWPEVKV